MLGFRLCCCIPGRRGRTQSRAVEFFAQSRVTGLFAYVRPTARDKIHTITAEILIASLNPGSLIMQVCCPFSLFWRLTEETRKRCCSVAQNHIAYAVPINSPYTFSKLRSAPPPPIPDASNGDTPPSKQARECSPEDSIETAVNAISVDYLPLTALDTSTIEEEVHESIPKPATTSRTDKKKFFVEWTQIQQLLQLAHCSACRKRLMDESSPPNVHRKRSAIVVRALAKYGNGAASLRFRE
ncbi:hypothetical protein L596_011321 [Steinernema carpocapsae]|uniref:Uncharacterized protein n=1 Tax=Steinernema carpocapsae TaxID=34508 RepID=A0A4U5NUG8_STECR|nr:hypothetical protein L596_011321 [Steinernema carpocapsae]